MMWGYEGWGYLWMLGFWFAFAALIVWAVKQPGNQRSRSASQILEERFARGEIDRDEFRARQTELRHS